MDNSSTESKHFKDTVAKWMKEEKELLILFRFANVGGNKSWEFFSSVEQFEYRLAELPSKTSVIVFKKHGLRLRGVADKSFFEQAKSQFANYKYALLICEQIVKIGGYTWYPSMNVDTLEELEEELFEGFYFCGRKVALGSEPNWLVNDENLIAAYIPNEDGVVETGAY
ncbi:hypothetical protein [Pleionea sp. CnH1-48]|uniref:hypothetical protein n=1 Tax=Pleionea sp. CnH1-48 TaxID=2954494 RepID=UPI002096BF06|nr:hypothetical protein [Pleionea sp. CnH1-48]MCO7226965.1 hypothetical protein [Pleionea sp. CnH1-48]